MSSRLIGWARDQRTGDPLAQLVLMLLADNANDAGLCWPSIATLAADGCMSERTVMRKIDLLESDVRLVEVERRRANGHQTSNMYRLRAGQMLRLDVSQSDRKSPRQHDTQSPSSVTQGQKQGDFGDSSRVTLASPKPSIEPSMNLGACADELSASSPALPRRIETMPGAISAGFAERYEDRNGYLARSLWEPARRVILAPNGVAAAELSRCDWRMWRAIGVEAIETQDRRTPFAVHRAAET